VITEQEVLTWWGEAPERPKRFSRVNRWIPIALIGYAGRCAEPWPSDRSRLGASFVLSRHVNCARRVPLMETASLPGASPHQVRHPPFTYHFSPFTIPSQPSTISTAR
jgi:hypothetical protein